MKIANTFIPSLILSGFVAICSSSLSAIASSSRAVMHQESSRPMTVEYPQGIEQNRQVCRALSSGTLFARTELFFGLSKAKGTDVTNSEFQGFVDREITPRFPDGLTLLGGQGQFKNSSQVIVKEPSRLLILLYPMEKGNNSNRKIEEIRAVYKKTFQQESVLRTDNLSCVLF
jgi:Protein of unknown function (DUF3574)